MINDFIPIVAIAWFVYFIRNNNLNNPLVGLIFISYLFFSTNYTNFGLDISFDIFRSLHRIIGVLCAILFLVYALRNRVNFFNEPVSRILIIFTLILLLSFLGNEIYIPHYIHYLRNFIFISLIILFLYFNLNSNEKLDELFKLIGLGALILSFFILLNIFKVGWFHRETLFYSNSNYLAIALLPGFTMLLFSKIKYLRFLSPIILISIFATGSRGVELAVAIILLLFLYSHKRSFQRRYLIVFLLAVITSCVLFFDQIVIKKKIDGTRLVISKIVFNAFSENPINGIGYGQFRTSFFKYIDDDIIQLNNQEINNAYESNMNLYSENQILNNKLQIKIEKMTHNDFFTIAAELGSIGLVFLVFMLYKLYLELKKLLLHSRNDYFMCISLIIGSLIFSLFHNNLTSFVFWFVLFVPFIMNRNYRDTS
jgi:O-antigen ligase